MQSNLFIQINCREMWQAVVKLHEEGIVGQCIILIAGDADYLEKEDWNYIVDPGTVDKMMYDEFIDINSLPPLDEEILKRAVPYESMAIHIKMRDHCFPMTLFEECERKYYIHFRVWDYLFEKYAIDTYIFTGSIPHMMGWYVQYAVAKSRDCKMMLSAKTYFPDRLVFGHSIESIGEEVGDYYDKILKESIEINLEEVFQQFLDKNSTVEHYNKKQYRHAKRKSKPSCYFWNRHLGIRSYFQTTRVRLHYIGAMCKHGNIPHRYRMMKVDLHDEKIYVPLIRAFSRNWMCDYRKYNKMAEMADYEENYVLYLLQLSPEETTMPRAGFFADQLLSIQMLAYVAQEFGLQVYVKEHTVQYFRNQDFYNDIKSIKNVRLIKTYENTKELIKNARLVSTQTGTVTLEAAMQSVPAICFGHGQPYKGLKCVYEVTTIEQCRKAFSEILSPNYKHVDDAKKYLYAIQKKSYKETSYEVIADEELWYDRIKSVCE